MKWKKKNDKEKAFSQIYNVHAIDNACSVT